MENSGSFKEKSLFNGVYFGEFKSKLFHGKGKYTWSNGTIYEGDWVDGKRTGKGRIIWPCGKKYKGGNGPVMGKNRNIYIGNWKNNQRDGRGIVKWASGEVLEGCWSNGLLRSGVYRLANGDVYAGDFKGSIFHEKGESAWLNDEIIYEGDWVNGKMTEKDWRYGHQEQIMRERSLRIILMVMAHTLGRMEVFTLEIGKTVK
ncbi:phosphatidylinositol 4-phosphate 5-kinase 8-like [Vicia villosa]|uniref:phosphatidylinositol 4-phosphate 5-kinase 8-like n=1 Tax=Vicia villosa TaxID=3911 RepID=UPI00273B0286|nr:phosphatidylinositol 4-phosphate 5-kinase 8-like [Vicia villosa]